MKVLLVGGGGREHALGWKIAQSRDLTRLYVAPGSPGLKRFGVALPIAADDLEGLCAATREYAIDLVIVGPEAPLAAGLADRLAAIGVPCFGPSKAAARLEASKAFMKEIALASGAPTAAFGRFVDASPARDFLRRLDPPYVVKADGLAAGKGVVIAPTLREADAAVDSFLSGALGDAGRTIVIEEFLKGEEASFFVLCDGERALPLLSARDYKRAFDGDAGPNTGGMGVYAPAPIVDEGVAAKAMATIIEPVLQEMRARGAPYRGVLYAGLMVDRGAPRLVEFNVRFGDPECQALMRLLDEDLLAPLASCAAGSLTKTSLAWKNEAAVVVVMAAQGYPGAARAGGVITGVERAETRPGVVVFHSGTEEHGGALRAKGGRVLSVTATGATREEAAQRAYDGVAEIRFEGGFWRRDIARAGGGA